MDFDQFWNTLRIEKTPKHSKQSIITSQRCLNNNNKHKQQTNYYLQHFQKESLLKNRMLKAYIVHVNEHLHNNYITRNIHVHASIKGRFFIRPSVNQLFSSPLSDMAQQRMAVAGLEMSGEEERAPRWQSS